MQLEPIARVRSSRAEPLDDDWDAVPASIVLDADRFSPTALSGLDEFCRLLRVDGLVLEVSGLDAIDGSPVVDIKPYMAEFGPRGPVRQPPWSQALMAGYWRSDDR